MYKLAKLTPWSTDLPQKLIVAQLDKSLPVLYTTQRFVTAFTRAR